MEKFSGTWWFAYSFLGYEQVGQQSQHNIDKESVEDVQFPNALPASIDSLAHDGSLYEQVEQQG